MTIRILNSFVFPDIGSNLVTLNFTLRCCQALDASQTSLHKQTHTALFTLGASLVVEMPELKLFSPLKNHRIYDIFTMFITWCCLIFD